MPASVPPAPPPRGEAAAIPRLPAAGFPDALATYERAAQLVADDAHRTMGGRDIFVAERAPAPGAMAVAFSRESAIAIHPGEAQALQDVAARARAGTLSGEDVGDLRRRTFTALHEASHVTGPAMPTDMGDDAPTTLLWEEGLASLNARRLLPALGPPGTPRPPVTSITYSGLAARVNELLGLAGVEVDSAAHDRAIRTLAEHVEWGERPRWVASRIARHALGHAATDAELGALVPMVHRYVARLEGGTGHLQAALRDLGATAPAR